MMHEIAVDQYPALLAQKRDHLASLLAPFDPPEIEVFASPVLHFRLRAEFRIWHTGERCFYAMFSPSDKRQPVEVTDFPIGSGLINSLMTQLLTELHRQPVLRHKLFQVEFLTTLSQDALVTLIYHKPLDDAWQKQAEQLQETLGFPVIGRSRKQKRVLQRDYVNETLVVDDKPLRYRQIEGGFTQPNGCMNQMMLSWARRVSLAGRGEAGEQIGDLLELYCGNGNFSIALADIYQRVLATEVSKTSVAAAQVNIRQNAADNVTIVRLSSEELVEAITGARAFRRLENIDLSDYDIQTVLVDPPRAGLDEKSVRQIQQYERIIYISCNPQTLADNLQTLNQTHRITHLALFDQFPYTHHIETGVMLERR
ncbi:MAG: tRNA (uridine(54)-C5)-methyltransferase TrmA [Proteobacteria bacterium]|nr:MAG: tRNA (uridine(54)-C5)-methyltransferase TrmA [Pseudomonadota bacterium]PIE40338.1 MAG: tRNA (uridine(54)-C5)-methyltransferase TrmA [Gammaproteobacteria bacterium]